MMAPNKGNHTLLISAVVFLLLSSLLADGYSLRAQTSDSLAVDKKKLRTFIIASAIGYGSGLATLNHVWYKDTRRQSFRLFNDNAEWKQIDKAGHFFASFYMSDLPARALRSCGVRESKSDRIGALTGFMLTIPIEILDGFSDGYGASAGDILADAAGPAFYLGQKIIWDEIRIHPKFSFHRTEFPPLRPALLGDDLLSEIVKDYNGQTYWFSFDMDKFTTFPQWLNVSLGYGAHGMVYARDNQNETLDLQPYRQYYLGLDVDLTAIKTRSKIVKTLLYVANAIRLPGPALEFTSKRTKFHPFYF
ncbi:MAG: DUF2279 domain-containing protein [Chryseosolibacter sp.]